MPRNTVLALFSLVLAGCSETQTAVVEDDSQAKDSGQSDGGQADAKTKEYSYEYCEDGEVVTGTCTEGICDPAPFEVCDDGSCVLAPGSCTTPPPPPETIDVTIKNERTETIYVDGLFVPFFLKDNAGDDLATHRPINSGTCDECDDICNNNLPHGDPSPCYVEIAPGEEVTTSWSAKHYVEETCSPSCDKTCIAAQTLAKGDYTMVVPYRLDLDFDWLTFTEQKCSSLVDKGWWGSSFGICMFDHEAEIAMTYDGQAELVLSVK